ncbi:MAG TPA: hypothetical protein VKB40_08600 [Candidatus Acidoferrales bacterium]|nr:hypothetical protein [Candidatus Acidoferrales bacterium]
MAAARDRSLGAAIYLDWSEPTLRRAIDAGLSPWWTVVFFIPFLNFVLMLVLVIAPSPPRAKIAGATKRELPADRRLSDAAIAIGSALLLAVAVFGFSTLIVKQYAAATVYGTPCAMGALAGFLFGDSDGHDQAQRLSIYLRGGSFSDVRLRRRRLYPDGISHRLSPDWISKLGVAYPESAHIEGSCVGAVRYCVFSTGAFVEPITAWGPGSRSRSTWRVHPIRCELSPYKNLSPPHLHGYLRSRRGEFRLIELPGQRTRLEGSTWYEVEMAPEGYWQIWSDFLIHRIHTRVLEHIKADTESAVSAQAVTADSTPR